jgi:hypothetical protein
VLTLNKNLSITRGKIRHRLALVTWRDSISHSQSWTPLDEIVDRCGTVAEGYSVGWLISIDSLHVVLCPNVLEVPGEDIRTDGSGGMTIPREAVVSIKYLT